MDELRMGAFDAVMYGVEDDPVLRSVILLVVMLESEPDVATVTERMDRVTRDVPKLRQKVVGNPVSLAPPRWLTDPNFDLAYHLRWYAMPGEDADERDVLRLAEQIAEQDFDRARPLWEVTLVTGLTQGRCAVIAKVHHSITDGVGGLQLAAALFDLEPDAAIVDTPLPEAPTAEDRDLGDRLLEGITYEVRELASEAASLLGRARSGLVDAIRNPMGSLFEAQVFSASAQRVLAPAANPLSDLLTGRSLSVRFVTAEVPFADLRHAAKALGVTVNDVYVAAVLDAVNKYHHEQGSHPEQVRLHMPVNQRTAEDGANGGNRWVPARFPVPMNEQDLALRLRQLVPVLRQARDEPALQLSDTIYRLLTRLPRPITTVVAGGLMKGTDVVATNVPGPPIPLYLGGALVEALLPFAPKGGAAVNFALMTYNGTAQVGINCDEAAVSDPVRLAELTEHSLHAIIALGAQAAGDRSDDALAEAPEKRAVKRPVKKPVKRPVKKPVKKSVVKTDVKSPSEKDATRPPSSDADATDPEAG